MALGYPALGLVLCTVGLVTFAGVSPARRAAAGWLLACFASLGVVTVSGAIAAAAPVAGRRRGHRDRVDGHARRRHAGLAADPGRRPARATRPTACRCWASSSATAPAFGVVLLLLGGRVAGRPIDAFEAVAVACCCCSPSCRTLVWAADGARLTRQVLRTEAYFRTLVHSSADITIVLDPQGRITWDSGAGQHPHGWTARDLEGRPLSEFVHAEDRAELLAALDAGTGDPDRAAAGCSGCARGTAAGAQYETVRAASLGGRCRRGRHAGRRRPATGWCCTCATSTTAGRPSSSSSGWPTPTT